MTAPISGQPVIDEPLLEWAVDIVNAMFPAAPTDSPKGQR